MKSLLIAVALVACKPRTTPPQTAPPPSEPAPQGDSPTSLDREIPFLDSIRTGTLDNGLTYFIRPNAKPENRIVFRLAVDAGSLLEDDDQRGLAHFVEHMAFNGTENYPGNELITFLEGTGTKFGAHLNAHTSFDETVYKLVVPADKPETVEGAYTIFRDWACCMTFAGDEIEKERGVVLEEWRRRLGPGQRYWDKLAGKLYKGAPHAERMPIGTEESLKGFEQDAARRYFKDWYRPDLMALILVGDVDPDEAEAKIKEVFGSIPAHPKPRERTEFPLEMSHEREFLISADPEATVSSFTVYAKRDSPLDPTWGGSRQVLLRRVLMNVINERLSERGRQPDSPWLRASVGSNRFNPGQESERLGVSFDKAPLATLELVLIELRRLQLHGVHDGEVDRARAAVLEGYRRALVENDTIASTGRANELVRHFLNGEVVPGIAVEAALAEEFVPRFTLDDLNQAATSFLSSDAEVFAMQLVEGQELPEVDAVKAVFTKVHTLEVEPLDPGVELTALVETIPQGGKIVLADARLQEVGFTGLVLSNGITVWHKRTDFKNDEIRMFGRIEGGHSSVSDEAWNNARAADSIVSWSGIGPHASETIRRFMKGKRASLGTSIQSHATSFSGTSSPDDFAIQLQRLYLTLTAARFNDKGLQQMKARWSGSVRNRLKNPSTHFSDAWSALNHPEDPRYAPTTLEHVEAVDLEGAKAVWDQAMQGVGRAEFVFVGNLPPDFDDQIRTWIGGLPAVDAGLTRKAISPRAEGDLSHTLRMGVDEKATFRMDYWGVVEQPWEDRVHMSATASILGVLLREKLREELGGVYGVGVRYNSIAFPEDRYSFRIDFTCDPGRVAELRAAVEATLAEVAEKGVDASYVEAQIAKNAQAHEERLKTNGYWMSLMRRKFDRGEDPRKVARYSEVNQALTPERVQEIVKARFDPARRAVLQMIPEG